MDGFLNMLKPPGMSSSDVVCYVRRHLPKGTRVGHGGTLDPDAAGVLPVCVGRAARLFDYIIDKQKTYIAELRLGIVTDTQDAGGRILSRTDASSVTRDDIIALLPRFTGDIDQIPPAYSALKRDGKKLCDMARRGETIDLEPRRVHVDSITVLDQPSSDSYLIRIQCGKGVYIRTLCHDIGAALGTGGHMAFLLRSQAGVFDVQHSVTLEEFQKAADENRLDSLLMSMELPLMKYPCLTVSEDHAKPVLNGVPIPPEWYEGRFEPSQPLRVYLGSRLIGMAFSDGEGVVRFKTVLADMTQG